jgi:hypothetical protein
MKSLHTMALVGGIAALAYYAGKRKSDAVRQTTRKPVIDPILGGEAASHLEGYFPTSGYFSVGALTGPAVGPYGRGHLHKTPCCTGCAQGRGCEG